ncbi:hypothetical protein L218DRAFT_1006058 [Marasmius fiardii PR-910]|nr:hypothetical protein L218DRAFT_1006058 [Marasmius fiardii PR-910]
MSMQSHSRKVLSSRKSGNYPLDPTIFQDDDYAPSQAASYRNANVPASFPVHVDMSHQTWSSDEKSSVGSDSDSSDDEPGLILALAQKENDAEEARKQKEKEMREMEMQRRQHARETRDPNQLFSGSLNSKNKADLQDIAYSLHLSLDGNKKDLITRINSHFDAHIELKEDPRFIGILSSSCTHCIENPPLPGPQGKASTSVQPLNPV